MRQKGSNYSEIRRFLKNKGVLVFEASIRHHLYHHSQTAKKPKKVDSEAEKPEPKREHNAEVDELEQEKEKLRDMWEFYESIKYCLSPGDRTRQQADIKIQLELVKLLEKEKEQQGVTKVASTG